MKGLRRLISVTVFLCTVACMGVFAQSVSETTKVRGTVLDAMTGQPVPFAAVYFMDSDTGTTTDDDGLFTLHTTDLALRFVKVQLLGYKTVTIRVKPGTYLETQVMLFPQSNRLDAITVRPDNEKAKRLLAAIDERRGANDPDRKPSYNCDVYSRIEFGLTEPRQLLQGENVKRQWKFIFDYIDTSEVSGQEYLPVLLTEAVAKRSHVSDPLSDTETIVASRMTGTDALDGLFGQFTGSLHLRSNFYNQFVNVFDVQIPSPICSAGLLYYDYYIVDSLEVDSRKTLLVHYHPKAFSSHLTLDGEMLVDAEDFALRSLKGKSQGGLGINWVKDIQFETSFTRQDDGTWFFSTDRFYADLSVMPADSSGLFSVPVTRTIEYSNPVFSEEASQVETARVVVQDDALGRSEEYWQSVRPYPLTRRQKNACELISKVKDTQLYKTWYDVAAMLVNGYYDVGPVGYGHVLKVFSYNPLEGFRIAAGIHTSPQFSTTDRLSAYVAFGCRDLQPKGGLKWEHLFRKNPTSKLTLDAHYDVLQLGKGFSEFNDANILSSALGDGWNSKLSRVAEGSVLYDHEFSPRFNTAWQVMYRHYFSTSYVPLTVPSMPTLTASALLRFSWDETVLRGQFMKTYAKSLYPVLSFKLDGGVAVLGRTHYPFVQPELALDWKAPVPVVGTTSLHFDVGTLVGKVPYPMLHLHEGNGTYLKDNTAFSTMDYFEFASDTWTTLRLEHNFMGLLLGRIPYIKKLNWREVVLVNATWGYLSDRNNGVASDAPSSALMPFPQGMHKMGAVPFVEAGFGITNIFRLLRVDFIWRCTHRDDARVRPRNFMLNLGVELNF